VHRREVYDQIRASNAAAAGDADALTLAATRLQRRGTDPGDRES
jgi:hypothetical protein